MKKIIVILSFLLTVFVVQAQNINHQNMSSPMGLYVNSYNGNLYFQRTDLFINGRKLPINLTFYYNSNNYKTDVGFGNGWSMEYLMKWAAVPNGILITRGDGYGMFFQKVSASSYKAASGVFDSLSEYQSGKFRLITKEKTIYSFDNATNQRLTGIKEINGNSLNFSYSDTLLTQVTDAASRSIQLTYQDGNLKQVTDALANPARTIQYKYDNYGNLTEAQDPLGNKFKYAYLPGGPLNIVTDKNGNAADIVYSSSSYLVKEIVTCNTDQRFSYNTAQGVTLLTELVSGHNQTTTYNYNSLGQITQKTGNCCGFNTKFEYDNNGNVAKFTDANGHVSTYTYDNKGNMLSKTDAAGNTLYITYNDMAVVTSFTDKNGNTTIFILDANGNVTKAVYPEGIANEFTYGANGDLLTSKDGNGNTTNYKYDNYGNVTEIDKPLGTTYKGSYDRRSRLLTVTDPNSNTTTFSNDDIDRITSVTDAASHQIKIVYDPNNNVTAYTDRNNHQTKFTYDAADRLIAVTNALGYAVYGGYDQHDNLTSFTDERGNTTKLSYDDLNRLTQVMNAANEITVYGYLPNGRLSNIIYPNGNNVQLTRDAMDRITQISDNIGTVSQRQYDAKGNLTSVTNGLGNTTFYFYDKLSRLIKRTDPLNFSESYTYDNNFNILSFTDKNGHSKHVGYDALNRAITYTDALNAVTSYKYDAAGNLTVITDANSNKTTYTYDNLNRQTATAYAIGPGNSSTYDNNGNVISYTDGNGVTTNYKYDAIDQLTKMDFPGTDDYAYSYDAAGNLIGATNADAVVSFMYDAVNRITAETLNGKTTGYTYNIPQGLFTLNYPSGRHITKTFDARNRLAKIIDDSLQLFSAVYDDANEMTTETHGNGEIINYTYDAGQRLLSKLSNSIPAVGFQYTYDNNGNKTSELKTHKPDHSEEYFYDDEDQLTEFKYGTIGGNDTVHHQKFLYDKLGNRITAMIDGNTISYTTNALNQYTAINGKTQTFDGNGSLTNDGTQNYNYNSLNQLISVGNTSFKYDALNRLIKTSTMNDSSVYSYSFLNEIETKKSGFNISNVFSRGLDDLININANGQNYFATLNNVNSVTGITDTLKNVAEFYEYEPFGGTNIFNSSYTNISNSTISNELQFDGRNIIASTKQYNFRFRYYSPKQGRFIQKDPLRYIDGMNDLTLTNNNQPNLIDPLGLQGQNTTLPDPLSAPDYKTDCDNSSNDEVINSRLPPTKIEIPLNKIGFGSGYINILNSIAQSRIGNLAGNLGSFASIAGATINTVNALNNGTQNTSTWVNLAIGAGTGVLTLGGVLTAGSLAIPIAATASIAWGVAQFGWGDNVNQWIDQNFGYRGGCVTYPTYFNHPHYWSR